jgi:hypothetical protein
VKRFSPLVVIGALVLVVASVFVVRNQIRVAQSRAAGAAAREARERSRVPLVAELQPVTLSNCELVRVGGPNDGGYLMCGNLMAGLETAYSYGIGGEDSWGCAVSRTHKVPVHQYDCFNPESGPCDGGRMKMNVECVGPRAETVGGRAFDTLSNQIASNGDTGRRMVVKMDVEGAEWASILATPDDVLASIDQMPI